MATTNTWGWSISLTTPQEADSFGSFNIIAHHRLLNVDSVAINLTATNGTIWTKAADVLGDNGSGFDAAAYLYRDTGKLQMPCVVPRAGSVKLLLRPLASPSPVRCCSWVLAWPG